MPRNPCAGTRRLLGLLSLADAPEEVTVWRVLKGLGEFADSGKLAGIQLRWTRRILNRASRRDLLYEGFIPVFADGTLLEGSGRREGTKYIKEKGSGVLWNTIYVGPLIAEQCLAREGEGEQTCVRRMLPAVVEEVLKPLKLHTYALALLDSLHGDGPTLDLIEWQRVHYTSWVPTNWPKLRRRFRNKPDEVWESTGANAALRWAESAVCMC
jgi:hypothetical protein